jgi:multisubunit Na+/H+ antiporter MnhB subunit
MPYVWRALTAWGICAAIGAVLYRQVRKLRVWRLTVNGIAAAIVALLVGWTLDPGFGLVALAAPVACFGLPGALIRGVRTRSPREAALVLGAWVAAGVAAAVAVTPIG